MTKLTTIQFFNSNTKFGTAKFMVVVNFFL